MENSYFFEQMRDLLGTRYNDFMSAYQGPRFKALRVNTLKITAEEFAALCDKYERDGIRHYGLKQNPLCSQSFYTDVKPSLDPLYHAGLYYMQEPSASAAVAAFSPFIGSRVLDLCAAPGGKSTQAAAFMRGGFIVCNDVEQKRLAALKENVERLGISNAAIVRGTAGEYRAAFDGYFDTLIVDAPCSGGGMMRYESVPYSKEITAGCAKRQREIIDDAVHLLCGGGYMLYSTCTFSPEEDEDMVDYIVRKGFTTVDIPLLRGEERGIDMPDARRIYPHNFDGEGHFFCVLKKNGDGGASIKLPAERYKRTRIKAGDLDLSVERRGDRLTVKDFDFPDFSRTRLKLLSVGVEAADCRDKTPVPSYALVHALSSSDLSKLGTVELGEKAEEYIRGGEIDSAVPDGYYAATVDGYALGAVKSARSGDGSRVLKNLYPKKYRVRAPE